MRKSVKTHSLRTVKVMLAGFLSAVLTLYMPVVAYAGNYDIDLGSVDIHAGISSSSFIQEIKSVLRINVNGQMPIRYTIRAGMRIWPM